MASNAPSLPPLSPEHRRVVAGQFERANQVVSEGNFEYGIQLLLSCCKIDPGNLIFRQALRRTQKLKYKNNLRGSWLAWLTTAPAKARMRRALVAKDYVLALEHGEHVLTRNPWHVKTQMLLAQAAESLGLLDLAVWNLEQARQKAGDDVTLNRALARLYERRGNFAQAIKLWELVRKKAPNDHEAAHKAKDLAANETIARGHYEHAVAGGSSGRVARPEPEEEETRSSSATRRRAEANTGDRPATPVEEESAPDRRVAREAQALQGRIEADPTNANNYLQLAGLYRRHGQIDQARAVLQKGLGPTGNHFELSAELTDLDIEPFRQNLAITEERLRDDPDNPEEELRRIRVRLLKEINTRELDLYRSKADRYPSEQSHRFELGVRLLRAGQIDEAIKELQTARTDPRVQWKALMYLGHCFKGRNNWKLARRNFEASLKDMPTNEDAIRKELYFQLAQGCADASEYQDAVHFATELANLDFGYRDIATLLDEWQTKLQS